MDAGEILAIVGESGSGKSVTSLSIMGLLGEPGHVASGEVKFEGKDLVGLSEKDYRQLRGNDMAMIFQEPMTSLNPVYRIGNQIVEAIRTHEKVGKKEARERAIDLLRKVGIPSPEKRIDDYPHQMSGGMRQRVMIAMALACNPKLLIADEPTTALDVTIQAQILDLLRRLRDETGMAVLLITHDLGVVSETADRVVVMYCGQLVEEAGGAHLVRPSSASLHAGASEVHPPPGGRRREAPLHDQGHGAEPLGNAAGLPFQRPMRLVHWTSAARRCRTWWTWTATRSAASCTRTPTVRPRTPLPSPRRKPRRRPTPRRRATWRRPRPFWRPKSCARPS